MKVKEKAKKQGYSKEEREYMKKLLDVFRTKGIERINLLKLMIDNSKRHPNRRPGECYFPPPVDIPAPAKVVPIEKKEEIQVKGKGKERKYIDNRCGRETEIEYNSREIEDLLANELWFPIESLFKFGEDLGMDDEKIFGFIEAGESLLREARRETEEICNLIEKHVGKIEVDFRSYHSGINKQDKLGLTFTPVEIEQAKEA